MLKNDQIGERGVQKDQIKDKGMFGTPNRQGLNRQIADKGMIEENGDKSGSTIRD